MIVNIIISCDFESINNIKVLIKSIKHNIKNSVIYLITDKYTDIQDVVVIVKENKWESPYNRITGHTYHRLFIDEYLPFIEKCIWLDWDTLVLDDISELLQDDNFELKAVGSDTRFNAAVLAFNFTESCKEKMKKCRSLISTGLDDEEILNMVFGDCYINIPKKYNNIALEIIDNPKVIHYIGSKKPWSIPDSYYYWLKYKNDFLKNGC